MTCRPPRWPRQRCWRPGIVGRRLARAMQPEEIVAPANRHGRRSRRRRTSAGRRVDRRRLGRGTAAARGRQHFVAGRHGPWLAMTYSPVMRRGAGQRRRSARSGGPSRLVSEPSLRHRQPATARRQQHAVRRRLDARMGARRQTEARRGGGRASRAAGPTGLHPPAIRFAHRRAAAILSGVGRSRAGGHVSQSGGDRPKVGADQRKIAKAEQGPKPTCCCCGST